MNTFMAICTFKEGTVMEEVFAVSAEEQVKVRALQGEGRLGAVRLAIARGKVFLEVLAADEEIAMQTVLELPIAKWWDIELYPVTSPPPQNS